MPYSGTPEERKAKQRAYYAINKDRRRANQKRYDDTAVLKKKDRQLRRAYGITIEQYNKLLVEQGGVCAICKRECPTGRALAVDHNHVSGLIRGLLCANHNRMLGYASDSVDLLEKSIEYLKKHRG